MHLKQAESQLHENLKSYQHRVSRILEFGDAAEHFDRAEFCGANPM